MIHILRVQRKELPYQTKPRKPIIVLLNLQLMSLIKSAKVNYYCNDQLLTMELNIPNFTGKTIS